MRSCKPFSAFPEHQAFPKYREFPKASPSIPVDGLAPLPVDERAGFEFVPRISSVCVHRVKRNRSVSRVEFVSSLSCKAACPGDVVLRNRNAAQFLPRNSLQRFVSPRYVAFSSDALSRGELSRGELSKVALSNAALRIGELSKCKLRTRVPVSVASSPAYRATPKAALKSVLQRLQQTAGANKVSRIAQAFAKRAPTF